MIKKLISPPTRLAHPQTLQNSRSLPDLFQWIAYHGIQGQQPLDHVPNTGGIFKSQGVQVQKK